MKEIPLTQGKVTTVDDEDFEWLNQWNWHCNSGYASRTIRLSKTTYKHVSMHRLIIDTPPGMDTDHINGNRLDNRKSNLRICTRAQNRANRGNFINNTSGYKGVTFYKCRGLWMAQIGVSGVRKNLGLYKTIEEAARAYDKAAKSAFGDFAIPNIKGEKYV